MRTCPIDAAERGPKVHQAVLHNTVAERDSYGALHATYGLECTRRRLTLGCVGLLGLQLRHKCSCAGSPPMYKLKMY